MSLENLSAEAEEELKELLKGKAADLYSLCDQEAKGFVTKRDMQRMRDEVPLNPDELETVFDRLDVDGNGYLTLEEFTDGFGEYAGLDAPKEKNVNAVEIAVNNLETPVTQEEVRTESVELDEEDEFNVMLSELGILGLVEDDSALRDMWLNLKQDSDPSLITNFEDFLINFSKDLKKKTVDHENLENVVKSRAQIQEEQVQMLYEEMERQIGEEKKKIRDEESRKEFKMREELETTLLLKDQQLMEVMTKMHELQTSLDEVKKEVPEMKEENLLLTRERDRLQQELDRQKILHKDMQQNFDSLRGQTQSERRERAKAALKVSENIAQEREGLVNQLDFMKALNAKMLDERDQSVIQEDSQVQNATKLSSELQIPTTSDLEGTSECEYDDEYFKNTDASKVAIEPLHHHPSLRKKSRQRSLKRCNDIWGHGGDNISLHEELACMDSGRGSGACDDEETSEEVQNKGVPGMPYGSSYPYSSSLLIYNIQQKQNKELSRLESETSCTGPVSYGESDLASFGTPTSLEPQQRNFIHPLSQLNGNLSPYEPVRLPERVFKVIFIGDSCVGKSSLIKRFCSGKFEAGLKSTIGVDFHTRSILVENQSICLQCWDTAGQERYRAITQQYFRKADAVIVVYDISSERSYLNAREWLDSAVDGAGEQAALMLLGNKLDLVQDDLMRKVRKSEGLSLSRQYSTLFGEVSAATGDNVESMLTEIAKLLREREDLDIQRALKLSLEKNTGQKKSCCNK